MRKVLAAILSASVVMFWGCAGTTAAPEAKTGLEGTKVNTYLIGEYVDAKSATTKLQDAGFEVIASYESVKKGKTIVFTNAELKAEGAKPGRANAAILRLFVDADEKKISFTNPVYFGKAFMQSEYNHTVFNTQLEKINKAFPGLKPSADAWDFDGLADYHFMVGMPYYADVDTVGVGANADLLAKAKEYKSGKNFLFELKLSENTTIIGYALGKRTNKFVEKIGRANAAILPYTIVIEDNKATALGAKYYIAISYPLLDMGGFMGIATVPGAIVADLEKPFK
ncbi:MAG: hypothetical protein FP820_00015 [Sulfurimonas sp.]|jgi:hypothetical protein|nr:hypothetical protein [Sulfurimonas sp.]MBU1217788.1 hypothetical protein [bacterium]MBU1434184.1 hypothetical protein [bacterium]MBU1504279.1 hypothetical protein [bacterium]MBU3939392.1 hypothetical protein [bacterium]